jgi:hypothetical protein
MRSRREIVFLIGVFLCLAAARQTLCADQQDTAVSLTIRFANGINQFHVGEVIPIELAFSASVDKTYSFETRNYDRSGRLDIEQFYVNPPGRDPLLSYYRTFGGFIGGGLGGTNYLTAEPQKMREDLNEWVGLDNPGHFSLFLTSKRVSRLRGSKPEPVELRSNTLEFDVIEPDPAWQKETLDAAVMVLDNSSTSTPEAKRAASHTLRFLDSPASIRELARQVTQPGEGSRWDFVAGLSASRHQELVLKELEAQFNAPNAAITADYISILAQTKFRFTHEPPPLYPKQGEQEQKSWSAQNRARVEDFNNSIDALYQKAVALVGAKQSAARAETVRTLLMQPLHDLSAIKPVPGLPQLEIVSAFQALSPQQQVNLMGFFWVRLKSPAMVDVLEKILEQPRIQNQQLRNLAMKRLAELDPEEATRRILAEIQHPHVDDYSSIISAETLSMLPNKTLPEFDQLLAMRLEDRNSRTTFLDAELIGRYATESILPRVKAVYETAAGRWACNIEDGLISYFLRVDPDYGVKRAAETNSYCLTKSLKALVQMKRWGEVEPAVIARLNDPDLSRARQAAETLALYGDENAEKAMWNRLRRFREQWADRENALQFTPNTPRDVHDAVSFQIGLVDSIGKAQNWLLTNEEISELEMLTLGSMRQEVGRWHWHSPVDLTLSTFDDQLYAATNNQYFMKDVDSLRAKLVQYPTGTQFRMQTLTSRNQLASVIQAINEVAQQHGLVIEDAAIK